MSVVVVTRQLCYTSSRGRRKTSLVHDIALAYSCVHSSECQANPIGIVRHHWQRYPYHSFWICFRACQFSIVIRRIGVMGVERTPGFWYVLVSPPAVLNSNKLDSPVFHTVGIDNDIEIT